MIPLDLCSQDNIDLASAHLQTKEDTVVTKATDAIKEIWEDTSLQICNLFQEDSTLAYNHIYGVIDYAESDTEEPVETAPIPSTEEKQSPTLRTIPQKWEDYAKIWFYSSPFGNESN